MGRKDPVLLGALGLGAVLRLYGIGHGLPFVYNPDEANIMARALSVAQGLDPEYYLYPSFFFYFLFGVMGALFVFGRLFGRYESVADFQARFFHDPTDFYLTGRLIGVVAALATIVLTYRLTTKHFGRTAGRAAAIIVAVCYFNVRDAHYLKHDVPSGLLVILGLTAIDWACEEKTARRFVVAGCVLGVGFATHYYLIFLAPAFALVARFRPFKYLLAAGAASAVTFFLLSPFVVLRLGAALEHMRANRQVVVDRSLEGGAAIFPSLGAYVSFLLEQGLGYVMMALVVVGFVLMGKRAVLWSVFPLLFLGFISYTFFAGRYLNPILPALAAAGGVAVAALAKRSALAAHAVLGLACVQPLYESVQVDRLFAGQDTRTVARAWIVENVPRDEGIALQSYSVPLPQSAASFRASLAARGAEAELEKRGKYRSLLDVAEGEPVGYELVFFGQGDELDRRYVSYESLHQGLDLLRAMGVSVVVLRVPPVMPPPEVAGLFEHVRRQGKLLHRVEAGAEPPYLDNEDWPPSRSLARKGPTIEIWSLE